MRLVIDPATVRRWAIDVLGARDRDADTMEMALPVCPKCGDAKKFRHYLNARSGAWGCYRNGCKGHVSALIMELEGLATRWELAVFVRGYGGSLSFAKPLPSEARADAPAGSLARAVAGKLRHAQLDAPGSPLEADGFDDSFQGPAGEAALFYARRRGLPEWFIASGRAGVCASGEQAGRLLALVMEDGLPVYAVGRAVNGEQPKYLCPGMAAWGRGKSDVVFNLDLAAPGADLLVCEGWISALSAGPGGVATLGQGVSPTQAVKMARRRPGGAFILFEGGACLETAVESAALLQGVGVECFVAPLLDGDPNDNPGQVPEVLAQAAPVTLRDRAAARIKERPRVGLAENFLAPAGIPRRLSRP